MVDTPTTQTTPRPNSRHAGQRRQRHNPTAGTPTTHRSSTVDTPTISTQRTPQPRGDTPGGSRPRREVDTPSGLLWLNGRHAGDMRSGTSEQSTHAAIACRERSTRAAIRFSRTADTRADPLASTANTRGHPLPTGSQPPGHPLPTNSQPPGHPLVVNGRHARRFASREQPTHTDLRFSRTVDTRCVGLLSVGGSVLRFAVDEARQLNFPRGP
jgi:hypothetical protein